MVREAVEESTRTSSPMSLCVDECRAPLYTSCEMRFHTAAVGALCVLAGFILCPMTLRAEEVPGDDDAESSGYQYQPSQNPPQNPKPTSVSESAVSTRALENAEARRKLTGIVKLMGGSLEAAGNQVGRGAGSIKGALVGPILGGLMSGLGKALKTNAIENTENENGFIPWQRTTPYKFGRDEVILRITLERLTRIQGLALPEKLMHSLTLPELMSLSRGRSEPIERYLANAEREIAIQLPPGKRLHVRLAPFVDDYRGTDGKRPPKVSQPVQSIDKWVRSASR